MRAVKEVGEAILSRAGRYRDVEDTLKVKEVWVGDRRYVLCYNPEEAAKDKADREAILEALEEELERNPKALVSNRGYRRFLKIDGTAISINKDKVGEEERFDGKCVVRTNTTLPAGEVALRYKELWMVEAFFRAAKSLLERGPVFHKYDDTIRDRIFSSFLALLLRHELISSLALRGEKPEWADIVTDLAALQEVEVEEDGRRYRLRLPFQGLCGKVFRAVGVAVPSPRPSGRCSVVARPTHVHANTRYTGAARKPAVEDDLDDSRRRVRGTEGLSSRRRLVLQEDRILAW